MAKKKKLQKTAASVSQRWNKKKLRYYITEFLKQNPSKQFNYKQLAKTFGIDDEGTRMLIVQVLQELVEEKQLTEVIKGKYQYHARTGQITGKVDMTRSGTAYIVSDDIVEDVFVAPDNQLHAMDGDTVRVQLYAHRRRGKVEGEVIEILQRARENFVGVLEVRRNFAFLVAEGTKVQQDIYIPIEALNGAKDGEKAVARIVEWPRRSKNPIGEIVRVLGQPGQHETEIHAILAEFELPYDFPPEVDAAANAIDPGITSEEIARRRDFRHITTFTIDPVDAKDFDDALSLRRLPNGNWEVGVHIADVTHYIDNVPVLDSEAYERGTSVYLVDRVVPMLPERLSNFICSLRPHEEKLTYSAVFELNDRAQIVNEWFGRTVILSDHRFAYEEAQLLIEGQDGPFATEVRQLDALAKILRSNRFVDGALGFERDEVKFHLDPDGHPTGVYYKQIKDANHLIEEFMLLANRRVATWVGKVTEHNPKPKTFVYRVHDDPDPEKLFSLSKFIRRFGYKVQTTNRQSTISSLNELLQTVKGKSEENLVTTLTIRSMAKAEYSPDNIGHYGLAFDYYTHFTSPIRRYPDVMVHRLLTRYLAGAKSEDYTAYKTMCVHSSKREQLAAQAERASIKFKQVEFMADKIGQVFDGHISGVTDWGIYVELDETKIEGLVPLRDMEDDYYQYDDKNYCITGHRHHKVYQLGDPIRVEISRCDLVRKVIDFGIAPSQD